MEEEEKGRRPKCYTHLEQFIISVVCFDLSLLPSSQI